MTALELLAVGQVMTALELLAVAVHEVESLGLDDAFDDMFLESMRDALISAGATDADILIAAKIVIKIVVRWDADESERDRLLGLISEHFAHADITDLHSRPRVH